MSDLDGMGKVVWSEILNVWPRWDGKSCLVWNIECLT